MNFISRSRELVVRRVRVSIIVRWDAARSIGAMVNGMRVPGVRAVNCAGSLTPSVRRIVIERNFPTRWCSFLRFREFEE